MSATFDNANSANTTTVGAGSLTFTLNIAASANYLLVCASLDRTNSAPQASWVTCTAGGVSMSQITPSSPVNNGNASGLWIFELVNPPTGSSVSIVITNAGGSNTNNIDALIGGAMSFIGYTGRGTPVTVTSGVASSVSATVPGVAATSVVAAFCNAGDDINSPSPGTSEYIQNVLHSGGATDGNSAGAINTGTGTVTITWGGMPAGDSNCSWGVEVQGAASAPVPPPSPLPVLPWRWQPPPAVPPTVTAAAPAAPRPLIRVPRRPAIQRARIGAAGLCAAGLVGTIGIAGTPPRPFPVSHPQPQRARTGQLGRSAGGVAAGPNRGFQPPPPPRPPRIVRIPLQRAVWHGNAGPANHGYTPPPAAVPFIPHPRPQRAHTGTSTTAGGITGPVNHSFGPPPLWHPQPRRPGPSRAIGKGQPGGPNQTVSFVAVGPPAWRPLPPRRTLARALWRGVAGPANHGVALPPVARPPRIVRPLQRALWKGQAGPPNHGFAPPPGVQPQIRHPRSQRALWRGLTAQPPRPGPPSQRFTQPRRPRPLRAIWRSITGKAAGGAVAPQQGTASSTLALASTASGTLALADTASISNQAAAAAAISDTLAATATITNVLAATATIENEL